MPRYAEIPARGLRIRRLEPGDEAALADLFGRMSAESRRLRYLAVKPRLTSRELAYLTDVDHVSHEALAAVDERGRFLAVARYAELSPCTADVAVEVADEHHGRGLGAELMRRIADRARENGYLRLSATTLWENAAARALFKRLGYRATGSGGGAVDLELRLREGSCAALAA